MDRDPADAISYAPDSESVKICSTPGTLIDKEAMPDPEAILEVLKGLHLDIECCSEKLLNLDLCITDISLGEDDLGGFSMERCDLSDEQSEKTLALDLSLGYLGSEVLELERVMSSLQVEILAVCDKLPLLENEQELAILYEDKLGSLEATLKPLQEKLVKMKKQLGTLQRIRSTFGQRSSHMFADENSIEEFNEYKREMKSKLLIADQTVTCVEVAVESTWLKLLEAENSAEVYKGLAREMVSRLQILQLSLNGSLQREAELNSQLEVGKKFSTDTGMSEMNALKKKLTLLEENLQSTESNLRLVSDTMDAKDKTILEMGNYIHSIEESAFVSESRAEVAEAKVAELTEANIELSEEVGFLKSAEGNTEKISSLEKQVRDLEKQLQYAKAATENSLEQQNLLYNAIWDMETLIEDLKSKVSKAEAKLENAEDRCLTLAETNSDLNKEIGVLKSRAELLEASLKDVSRTKAVRAKDINAGAKIMTDMVMQLATERERIQKQLCSLERENMILMAELRKSRKNTMETADGRKEKSDNDKEAYSSANGFPSSESEYVEPPETSFTGNQGNESPESTDDGEGLPSSPDDAVNNPCNGEETAIKQRGWDVTRICIILMAVLVPVFSAAAMVFFSKEGEFAGLRHYVGQ